MNFQQQFFVMINRSFSVTCHFTQNLYGLLGAFLLTVSFGILGQDVHIEDVSAYELSIFVSGVSNCWFIMTI